MPATKFTWIRDRSGYSPMPEHLLPMMAVTEYATLNVFPAAGTWKIYSRGRLLSGGAGKDTVALQMAAEQSYMELFPEL